MTVRIVEDPAADPRWSELLDRHPTASIFHSPGWLRALQQTYGYRPFVLTASTGDALQDGIVACHVKAWPSRRVVSLPFSDHCNPLTNRADDLSEMLAFLMEDARENGATSVEIRSTKECGELLGSVASTYGMHPAVKYCLHRLELEGGESEMFLRFHHSARGAIRRADREGLTYEAGTSEQLLESFYRLLRMTRRRHRLPPQPLEWFRNLLANLGDSVSLHVARKNRQPIASMLTLSFKRTIYYKYGASDAAHHRLGAVPFLFWRVIKDARERGFDEVDLGRSDIDQAGLIEFKNRLGATPSTLTYYGYPQQRDSVARGWISGLARGTFAFLPNPVLDLVGKLIYHRLG